MATYQSSYTGAEIDAAVGAVPNKQDTLVSGTNIKTINNQSILGSGNIYISSGGDNYIAMTATWDANDEYLESFAFDDASAAYTIYNANGANTIFGIETGTMDGNTFVSDDFYYYAQVDQENAGAQQYFFFEFWDNTDKYKVTIQVNESTLSVNTYSHESFAIGDYLPLTGGTLTGALTVSDDITTTGEITLNNGKYIKAKDSGGTDRNIISVSSADNLTLGYGLATVGQVNVYGTSFMVRTNGTATSNTALTIDSSKNAEFTGYIKAVGDIYLSPSTSTTNTDSKKLYFRTSHFADSTNNVGPYVQAITHSSTYGRKRLSVFQVNAASYTGTYSEVFTILPNGNVGIGTTSPTTALGVTGDVAISGGLSLGGQAVVRVFSGSSAPSSGTGSDGDIYIQTS